MNEILFEAKSLICKKGNVWLWNTESMDGVRRFASNEDAQKYMSLYHEFDRDLQRPETVFGIGTEADFNTAKKKHERDCKAKEVKAYCKYADSVVSGMRYKIGIIETLKGVLRGFDGKILNKRFHDKIKAETGMSSKIDSSAFELYKYNSQNESITIVIRADWSTRYNRDTNKTEKVSSAWRWNTNERLEAEKAVDVVEREIESLRKQIEEVILTKKRYASYMRLVRKAESIMDEMEKYDIMIHSWAREHDMKRNWHYNNFWPNY